MCGIKLARAKACTPCGSRTLQVPGRSWQGEHCAGEEQGEREESNGKHRREVSRENGVR